MKNAVIKYKRIKEEENKQDPQQYRKKMKRYLYDARDYATMYPYYIKLLKDAEQHEFEKFLQERWERGKNTKEQRGTQEEDNVLQSNSFLEDVINALCNPNVIHKAAEILLK